MLVEDLMHSFLGARINNKLIMNDHQFFGRISKCSTICQFSRREGKGGGGGTAGSLSITVDADLSHAINMVSTRLCRIE